ncbi:hypothetical protein Q8W71_03380 [Methylobacterium sp. NEAU 140]|uniref:hypothetical protein n=1 Tax=Methylobacterium sp. NEAU 140 TaxID=3064945 RepID=UPI0027338A61|nr:hypothetical protein [Methylobacterium sp. NEAU 140]MDP4021655.1 hypothetical protein [Methylobacterium sp. NEAU 140]
MPARSPATTARAPRPRRALAGLAALLVGLLPLAATAADDPFGDPGPRRLRQRRPPPALVPPPPGPPIISGYLPRNNAVPMYNQPPRRAPVW